MFCADGWHMLNMQCGVATDGRTFRRFGLQCNPKYHLPTNSTAQVTAASACTAAVALSA
jgi:hypothetical protein